LVASETVSIVWLDTTEAKDAFGTTDLVGVPSSSSLSSTGAEASGSGASCVSDDDADVDVDDVLYTGCFPLLLLLWLSGVAGTLRRPPTKR